MFLRVTGRLLFPFIDKFIKKVNGLENIPKKGPFIVAANHTYFFDVPILEKIFVRETGRKVKFIVQHSLIANWLGNKLLGKWLGYIPVHPTKYVPEKAIPLSIKALHKHQIIAIFPEGTSELGKLVKFHTGVARIALEGYPVLPVGIKNVRVIARGKKYSIPKMKKVAVVNIGKPIKFKKVPQKEINKKLLEKEARKIMKNIAKLCDKKYPY